MGDKSLETLCNKIEFLSILVTFAPFPPKQCWFFYFFDCTDHSAYTTLNWGPGGIRELTLEANKIEQMLKYRKASFPKSVSTAFVAHCRCRARKNSHCGCSSEVFSRTNKDWYFKKKLFALLVTECFKKPPQLLWLTLVPLTLFFHVDINRWAKEIAPI